LLQLTRIRSKSPTWSTNRTVHLTL